MSSSRSSPGRCPKCLWEYGMAKFVTRRRWSLSFIWQGFAWACDPAVTARGLEREALHELDDGQVVLEHLAGDHQAFGALVDRYQTRLLNFINRTIGDRERAEDLVQEVFIRVFRHLHRFDQTKKFSTWIYTIASNLA